MPALKDRRRGAVDARRLQGVLSAFHRGDFTVRMPVTGGAQARKIARTLNRIIALNQRMSGEFQKLEVSIGEEGKTDRRASLAGATGSWTACIKSINTLVGNLIHPTNEMARVIGAVAQGDLSQTMSLKIGGRPLRGQFLRTAQIVNTMVDQLGSFASEVTRVAREVGTEGKLGGQAVVKGVAGTWKDLTDNVNSMASNLTAQVRNIADVTTAVAKGDLSRKITVDVRGEILELKNTINTMVDQLGSFASEVTRVAREVGTEGKLGGQAQVKGVAGTWKDLTDNVNSMASNLTAQVRNIADVTTAVAKGDLSRKITVDVRGEILELKNTINTMVDQLGSFASEVTRVAREVGTEGKLGGQAVVKGVAGTWKDLTDNVNSMAANLTAQVRNIADVTTAVAKGDLSRKITVDVQGEILELKNTINTMVDQLNSFASEVTRVAREVGTEGKLGGQAMVKGVAGTWKDLTDNVNSMAANLTTQVRGIAKVVTSVANGDLKRKLVLDVKGEIAELAETINGMIDTLAVFADQVTTVAREVGIEGKLGGQASVPGAAGLWRHLTDNVNQLAANLTTQVRAIADVATAVTKGDLTRSISVEAQGEVASLKDNINEMIHNLKQTTTKNRDQDWLKTNLARFTRLLQGQRDLLAVSRVILSELAPLIEAQHGVFFVSDPEAGEPGLRLVASYAHQEGVERRRLRLGEGLIGQCAAEKRSFRLTEVPDGYLQIGSGLGTAPPRDIVVLPVLFEGEVKAVIELASFQAFTDVHLAFLEQLTESIGIVLNTIAATTRTEELLKQSQALTEELKETNRRLEQQNQEVEQKNREVEQARRSLEEKAAQLALTSRYKSQFLANTSHELRTPLNSLLILSKMLAENADGNLTPKQVEFSNTIHSSGSDLLELINDILDLSKIESGTMVLDIGQVPFRELQDYVERSSRHVAMAKGLEFSVELDGGLPDSMTTDFKRLQQVLKNLLSNAFKFTERGRVGLRVGMAEGGWSPDNASLNAAASVVSLAVSDTGVGIAKDKQQIIFEAFQQADGTTNRKYGGTGLGLSISREIARLLGGEVHLESAPGEGSVFTLFLPLNYAAPQRGRERPPAAPTPGAEEPLAVAVGGEEGFLGATVEPARFAERDLSDDRAALSEGDRVFLIVDDDAGFARILLDRVREHGFKGLVATRADRALSLCREYRPVAILLDVMLPDMNGWTVLDRLKRDPATRHTPVYIVSGGMERGLAAKLGALGFLAKPATKEALDAAIERLRAFAERPERELLVVAAADARRQSILDLVAGADVRVTAVRSADEALAALRERRFDCAVLDAARPGADPAAFLRGLGELPEPALPVVVYGTQELSREEERLLEAASPAALVAAASSPGRLLERALLALHRPVASLNDPQRRLLDALGQDDPVLAGRKVLIVDDDVRNIFALTTVLERCKMRVLYAESGRQGLAALKDNPQVDIVLMDVMMPEMDGYETMGAIRRIERFKDLPIISLTAKAMKGDREKCIQAGASDYLAKPVDPEHLCSLLRVWLTR